MAFMNSHHPAFNLRMRTGWEAADMGILLWRTKTFFTIAFFTAPIIITTLIMAIIGFLAPLPFFAKTHWIIICTAAHFWLAPFYDRFALHVCSKIFFERGISIKSLFHGLAENIVRSLPGDLLWRRFSPIRGVMMPLRILEKLKRTHIPSRKASLKRGGIYFGAFLTGFCISVEIMLFIGSHIAVYVIGIITKTNIYINIGSFPCMVILLVNFIIIETLYICMSFSVYINSRIITEGWDLQFAFQKLAGART